MSLRFQRPGTGGDVEGLTVAVCVSGWANRVVSSDEARRARVGLARWRGTGREVLYEEDGSAGRRELVG